MEKIKIGTSDLEVAPISFGGNVYLRRTLDHEDLEKLNKARKA